MNKTYSELIKLSTFEDRYNYLKLDGRVGESTFGFDRYLNQVLYKSKEWKEFRRQIIIRDNGCDLAFPNCEIQGKILVHHIEPLTKVDVIKRSIKIFDPENVVCVSHMTHEAIHYGDESLLPSKPIERSPGDTKLW